MYVAWSSDLVFTCRRVFECWASSATEYAKVSLLVCKRLTLIIAILTFLGIFHTVRDKPGKYHPYMLRRSTAATSVMRCELVIAGGGDAAGNDIQHLRFTVPKICSGTRRSKHNRYLQVAQFVARGMLCVCIRTLCYHLGNQSTSFEMGCRRRIPSTACLIVLCRIAQCSRVALWRKTE